MAIFMKKKRVAKMPPFLFSVCQDAVACVSPGNGSGN